MAENGMDNIFIIDKLQELEDIELAALLCLVAEENCIIRSAAEDLDDLEQELRLISSNVFGLSCAVVECSSETTLDEFGEALLSKEDDDNATQHKSSPDKSMSSPVASSLRGSFSAASPEHKNTLDERKIANVVIAKGLNQASHEIQIQALELIRAKRIFSRTAVHTTPKRFVFIALLSADEGDPRLTKHLNDLFAISHYHAPENGLRHLWAHQEREWDDAASSSSVVRTSSANAGLKLGTKPVFSAQDINNLQTFAGNVKMTAEVRAYLHNIVTFLRLNRCVAGGISALATRHFHATVKALSALHAIPYITPSIVALAARKIYPHRIILATPKNERSLQWGSDQDAVAALLEGVTPDDVIEDVLDQVDVPA